MNGLLSLGTTKLGVRQQPTGEKTGVLSEKTGALSEKLLVPKIQLQEKPRLCDAAFL